jgi:hypothetical protein
MFTSALLFSTGNGGEAVPARFSLVKNEQSKLPDQLETELNLAGSRRGLVQRSRKRTAVEVKGGVVLTEGVQESWRKEVGVVENVEELRSELGVKGFGDFGYREVLEYGEINGGKTRPVEFVATGVTQNVGTILLAGRRGNGRTRI